MLRTYEPFSLVLSYPFLRRQLEDGLRSPNEQLSISICFFLYFKRSRISTWIEGAFPVRKNSHSDQFWRTEILRFLRRLLCAFSEGITANLMRIVVFINLCTQYNLFHLAIVNRDNRHCGMRDKCYFFARDFHFNETSSSLECNYDERCSSNFRSRLCYTWMR